MGNSWSSALPSLGPDAGPPGATLVICLWFAVGFLVPPSVVFLFRQILHRLKKAKRVEQGFTEKRRWNYCRPGKKQGGLDQRDQETPGEPGQKKKNTQDKREQRENKKEAVPEQGFLPGLPNEIVFEHIATRIPWSSMYALVYVNQKWRSAIRSQEIYNFRKHLGVRQSMIVAAAKRFTNEKGFYDVLGQELWLFSLKLPREQESFSDESDSSSEDFRLNFIPHKASLSDSTVHHAEKVMFLDGKLYAISSSRDGEKWRTDGRRQEVHMLDVAASHATWKLCSSTIENGPASLWEVCNGKIYAFHSYQSQMHGKVFDPKSYQWEEIEHKPSNAYRAHNYHRRVVVLNERVYVADRRSEARMMVFDTTLEKWQILRNTAVIVQQQSFAHFFMVEVRGKMYNSWESQVEVYNPESNSWTLVQQTVHKDFMGDTNMFPTVEAVTGYGNELLAVLKSPLTYQFSDGNCVNLCKSVGFGIHDEDLIWKKIADFPLEYCKNLGTLEL